MEKIFKTKWWAVSIIIIFYVSAIVFTYSLMPRAAKFDRSFEIGRPWSYGLVTAPSDFPIYKLPSDLALERDSASMRVVPYVKVLRDHGSIDGLKEKVVGSLGDRGNAAVSEKVYAYLEHELQAIYESGVISLEGHTRLSEFTGSYIYIISESNIARKVQLSLLYTKRTAYDKIMANADGVLSKEFVDALSTIDLDKLLRNNLVIDEDKTTQSQEEARSLVSPTMGVVQKGEKIIDRGEVVDRETYKILLTLEKHSEELTEDNTYGNIYTNIGKMMLILCMFGFLYSYFYFFRSKELRDIRTTIFILMMMMSIILSISVVVQFTQLSIYLIPIGILPIVVRIFFDSRTALYLHLITVLLTSMMVTSPYEYIIIQMSVGIVAVSSLRDLHARSQLMASALYILLTYIVVHTALKFVQGISVEELSLYSYLSFALNSVFILFAYGLIYIVEKLFGFLSSMTLVELSNVNNSLLMDFSEKCPGTFQHVLQVSNLSVEVAKKINANALLARTGALYHDIGKMENPMLYTENQAVGVNPLMELAFDEAAQVIISHVQSGVRIAQKHRLPRQIVDFISTHHGNSKTKFFYNSYKNAYPDAEIDESKFTYSGPLPATKESVIVMMADAIEAASRSLRDYKEETIDKMVESIVEGQMSEGQYKNAPISFLQVEKAKKIFKQKLKTIYHNRISYPELKK